MVSDLALGAAALLTHVHRLDVAAHNLSNASTVGFKRAFSIARRKDLGVAPELSARGKPGELSSLETRQDWTPGSPEKTGRSLDLAILGEGFFQVSHEGRTAYTRDGRFSVGPGGAIVHASGWTLSIEGGLQGAAQGAPVRIEADGVVRVGDTAGGRVRLFRSSGQAPMKSVGQGLFQAGESVETVAETRLRPGFLEKANVSVVREMADMMEAVRAFESVQRSVRAQDESYTELLSRLGRFS